RGRATAPLTIIDRQVARLVPGVQGQGMRPGGNRQREGAVADQALEQAQGGAIGGVGFAVEEQAAAADQNAAGVSERQATAAAQAAGEGVLGEGASGRREPRPGAGAGGEAA